MSTANLVTALLFAATALVVIIVLTVPILRALFQVLRLPALPTWQDLPTLYGRRILSSRQKLLEELEQKSRTTPFRDLRTRMRSLFVFDPVGRQDLIEAVGVHHLRILQFLISLGRLSGARLDSVPQIEQAIKERVLLQRTLADTKTASKRVHNQLGKKANAREWAAQEFDRKLAEVAERLRQNTTLLQSELSALFDSLEREDADSGQVIH